MYRHAYKDRMQHDRKAMGRRDERNIFSVVVTALNIIVLSDDIAGAVGSTKYTILNTSPSGMLVVRILLYTYIEHLKSRPRNLKLTVNLAQVSFVNKGSFSCKPFSQPTLAIGHKDSSNSCVHPYS